MKTLLAQKKVTWNASDEFESCIESLASKSLDAGQNKGGASEVATEKGWEYTKGSDLDDAIIFALEEHSKIYELSRSYRRARMQQFVLGKEEI